MEKMSGRIYGGEKKQTADLMVFAVFLVLAVCFVFMSSDSTSPRFPTAPVYEVEKADPAIFTVVGRYWLEEGRLPYTGLFDHKGPIIFLLDGLGWLLTGSANGIAVIQAVFLFAYCLVSYATLRKKHARLYAFIAVVISLILLRNVYGGGNTVEEFGLPVHALCFLGLYQWSIQEGLEHDPRWSFVYGLSVGFFILNRMTDALCAGIGCLVVIICLVRAGMWKNIFENMIAGVLGVALPVLLFSVYFACHGTLDAFWYGMIGYNMEYAAGEGKSFWFLEMGIKESIEVFFYCVPIWMSMGIALMLALRRQFRKAMLWGLMGAGAIVFLLNSKFYDHYVINYVPLSVAALSELDIKGIKKQSRMQFAIVMLAAAALLGPSAVLAVRMEQNMSMRSKAVYMSEEKPYDTLIAQIPQEDRDSVSFYNCMASIYLKHDIRPAYTYFIFQDWHGAKSEKIMRMIEEEFSACGAKWIMTHGGVSANIRKVLGDRYTEVDERDNYRLYIRNEANAAF